MIAAESLGCRTMQTSFLENPKRFADEDYVSTNEDILHCYFPSSGFDENQFTFEIANRRTRLREVGQFQTDGVRFKKIFNLVMRSLDALFFVIAIDEYDEKDPPLQDSIDHLRAVAKHSLFEGVSMVICLNKFDVFEKKDPNLAAGPELSRVSGPSR